MALEVLERCFTISGRTLRVEMKKTDDGSFALKGERGFHP